MPCSASFAKKAISYQTDANHPEQSVNLLKKLRFSLISLPPTQHVTPLLIRGNQGAAEEFQRAGNMAILYAHNGQEAVDLAKQHSKSKLRSDLLNIAQTAFSLPEDREKTINTGELHELMHELLKEKVSWENRE